MKVDIRAFINQLRDEYKEYQLKFLRRVIGDALPLTYDKWLEQRVYLALIDVDTQKQAMTEIANIAESNKN